MNVRPQRRPTAGDCGNMNHLRPNPPVRHCIGCGALLNTNLRAAPCDEAKHGAARRRQSMFCVDCGTRLITTEY